MRLVPLVVGVLFVAIGSFALASGDITDNIWWIVAAGAALCGVAGLITAIRQAPEPA